MTFPRRIRTSGDIRAELAATLAVVAAASATIVGVPEISRLNHEIKISNARAGAAKDYIDGQKSLTSAQQKLLRVSFENGIPCDGLPEPMKTSCDGMIKAANEAEARLQP